MNKEAAIKLFNDKQIRTHWDEEQEKWYFSIVDVIGVLTDSGNPNNYWKVLKNRLKKEGSELVTNCNQLKMPNKSHITRLKGSNKSALKFNQNTTFIDENENAFFDFNPHVFLSYC